MSIFYKSKAELAKETEKQIKAFLRQGGSIEVIKARKAPKQTMTCKNSRGFVQGTSGFPTGAPRKSTFTLV